MARRPPYMQMLTALVAIIWMVGVNHCAFEQVFSTHDASTTECPAHQKNSPDSHPEGRACGQQSVGSSQMRAPEPAVVFVLASALAILRPIEVTQNFFSDHLPVDPALIVVESHPLSSLSIASNAPPFRQA